MKVLYFLLIFLFSCAYSNTSRVIELKTDIKYLKNDPSDFDSNLFVYDSRRNTFIGNFRTQTHSWGVGTIIVTLLPNAISVKNDSTDTRKDGYIIKIVEARKISTYICRNII